MTQSHFCILPHNFAPNTPAVACRPFAQQAAAELRLLSTVWSQSNLVPVPSADRLSGRHTVRLCCPSAGQPAACWLKAARLSAREPCERGRSYSWPLTDSYPRLAQHGSHVRVHLPPSAGGSRECFLKGKRVPSPLALLEPVR